MFTKVLKVFANQRIRNLLRVAPVVAPLLLTTVAYAAPTIDMSGVTSVMSTVQTACLLIGAIVLVIGLIFATFSFLGGNVIRGVVAVVGGLVGGVVIGLAPTWISSLTGQAV